MIKVFAVVLLITLSQCAAECNVYESSVYCSSFEDIYDSNQESKTWRSVEIRSKAKQKINSTILTSVPNIKKIFFKDSVNDIADLTFAAPSHLYYIEFKNCDLPIIRENSFAFNSDDDVFLIIIDSKVNYLQPNCFSKSINLSGVTLRGNNITKININVFNGTSITILSLINNNIKYIEENALSNMRRLNALYLDRNFLTSFDPKLYLNNVPNLSVLYLSENKIEFVNKNSFKLFPRLLFLFLNLNKIVWIDADAFNGLTNLTHLNIANNLLYSLPESFFPYTDIPSLESLKIANNRLNYLPKHFLLSFPKLKEISLFGNPWQCVCYKDIMKTLSNTNVTVTCTNEFLDGQRPVCVVPRTGGGKCNENIPDPNELYKTFTEGLKHYNNLDLCT